jgi:hypothetical protein
VAVATAVTIIATNGGPPNHGDTPTGLGQSSGGIAANADRSLLARARYVLTSAPFPGAIQQVTETAGKTYVNGPNDPLTRSETWTELAKPYDSRTVSVPAGQFEEGQTNGQDEFYDPASNTIYRETNPNPQQQAGGDPALASALTM